MTGLAEKLLEKVGKTRADMAKRRGAKGSFFRRAGVSDSKELRRILELPRRDWRQGIGGRNGTAEELVELLTELWRRPNGQMRLWPIQAVALAELHDFGGLFGPIRVSGGKTLISFLAPAAVEAERPLLLVPGNMVKVTERKWQALNEHWCLPPIKIYSYNLLSRDENKEFLATYRPDLIIADEASLLKNLRAACTKQVHWWMHDEPETVFVPLTGSPTTRSLHEFAHLVQWALPKCCPVPMNYGVRVEWALCLDECKTDTNALGPGHLVRLCNDEELELLRDEPLSAVRKAYQRRLTDTPGVVSLAERGIDTPLNIRAVDVDIDTPAMDEAFWTLRKKWQTPDGRPFAEAVKLWAHCRELVCGFYYTWFNEEAFRQWLVKTLNEQRNTIGDVEQQILRLYASVTGKDIVLARALELLRSSSRGSGRMTFVRGTGSLSTNIKAWSPSLTASVTSAGHAVPATRADLWSLITATRPAGFVVSSAESVTACSVFLATILADSPQLLTIFEEAYARAEPPRDWLQARQNWFAFVRHVIQHNKKRLATELQVAKACAQGWYDSNEYSAWLAVRDRFKPNNVPVWMHDKTLRLATDWLDANPRGIVWTEHKAFALRLAEYSGRPFYGARGLDAKGVMIEDASGPIIASVRSNFMGRDLQHKWNRNLVVSCAPNGTVWEQMLARTHRFGQKSESVDVDVLLGCSEYYYGFLQALRDAKYQQDVFGYPQKLLFANIEIPSVAEVAARTQVRWRKGVKL